MAAPERQVRGFHSPDLSTHSNVSAFPKVTIIESYFFGGAGGGPGTDGAPDVFDTPGTEGAWVDLNAEISGSFSPHLGQTSSVSAHVAPQAAQFLENAAGLKHI